MIDLQFVIEAADILKHSMADLEAINKRLSTITLQEYDPVHGMLQIMTKAMYNTTSVVSSLIDELAIDTTPER